MSAKENKKEAITYQKEDDQVTLRQSASAAIKTCATCVRCVCVACSCQSITNEIDVGNTVVTVAVPFSNKLDQSSCSSSQSTSKETALHRRTALLGSIRSRLVTDLPPLRSVSLSSNDPRSGNIVYFDVVLVGTSSQILVDSIRQAFSREGFPSVRINSEIPNLTVIATPASLSTDAKRKCCTSKHQIHCQTVVNLEEIDCTNCVSSISEALDRTPGVHDASVSIEPSKAVVTHNPTILASNKIADRIDGLGYGVIDAVPSNSKLSRDDATTHGSQWKQSRHTIHTIDVSKETTAKVSMSLSGLSCASCVASIERLLRSKHGVDEDSVTVTLLPPKAVLAYDPTLVTTNDLAETVQDAGFDVVAIDDVPDATAAADPVPAPTTTTLSVHGMTCASCVSSVETAVGGVPGVKSVLVNLVTKTATIEHDTAHVGVRDLINFINDIGFEASLPSASGTSSGSKHANLDRDLVRYFWETVAAFVFAVPAFFVSMVVMMMLPHDHPIAEFFMQDVIVSGLSLSDAVMFVIATPVQIWLGARFHYGAYKTITRLGTANMDVLVSLGTSVAYIFSVYAVISNMVNGMRYMDQFFETPVFLILFVLLGRVLEGYAKNRTSDAMTKLMALAPDTALLVKFEEMSNGNSVNTLDVAHDCVESDAMRIVEETEIPVALVQIGDVLRVVAGGRFPVDGVVLRGIAYVDESMLTGEPMPVTKTVGDSVLTGTLNTSAALLIKVTRVGHDTALARIVAMVERAQSCKAPIQAFADRVSAVFVPAVLVASVLTFLGWYIALMVGGDKMREWVPPGRTPLLFAAEFAVAVLVVACPCALGLATPTAVMVGTGVAAKYGVLIKDGGVALEHMDQLKIVAMDKTGTLTEGRPVVTDVRVMSSVLDGFRHVVPTVDAFWDMLARIESGSQHPLAVAISTYAKEASKAAESSVDREQSDAMQVGAYELTETTEVAGRGVWAVLKPRINTQEQAFRIVIGNQAWLREQACQSDENDEVHAHAYSDEVCLWEKDGKTVVYVGVVPERNDDADPHVQGQMLAVIAVSDRVREESSVVVQELQKLGIDVWMITGDVSSTAHSVASQVGIPSQQVISGVRPGDKADHIASLQNNVRGRGARSIFQVRRPRRSVGMVGDGVNDAVALMQADVGIAIGTGTDIAVSAANVVLMRSDLRCVVIALEVAHATLRRVRCNLVWALAYNVFGMFVAAGLFYPWTHVVVAPWAAGLAMALSSVSVVMNSLMLGLVDPAKIFSK